MEIRGLMDGGGPHSRRDIMDHWMACLGMSSAILISSRKKLRMKQSALDEVLNETSRKLLDSEHTPHSSVQGTSPVETVYPSPNLDAD